MKKIIAFAGSNRSDSIHKKLITYAAAQLQDEEILVQILDLSLYDAPIFNNDLEEQTGIPPQIIALSKILADAEGFIIASPEHNGSLTAFFKNMIDWLSRVNRSIFNNKPVALLSASPGARGGKTGLAHLEALMPYLGGTVTGRLSIGNIETYLNGDQIQFSEALDAQLFDLLQTLRNAMEPMCCSEPC